MSQSNLLIRKPYFLFLFGGIGACVLFYAVFSLTFISLLIMLIGFVFPASFLSPEIQEIAKHRRYRFSSLRLMVSCNQFFLESRFITRLLTPHCFSFFVCVILRVYLNESSLVFWLVGVIIFELIGRLISQKNQLFSKLFKAQRDDQEIDSGIQIARSDL